MFKAIEYGVSHGGADGDYKPGDCQLQSSSDSGDCDGKYYNLDLYVRINNCEDKNNGE